MSGRFARTNGGRSGRAQAAPKPPGGPRSPPGTPRTRWAHRTAPKGRDAHPVDCLCRSVPQVFRMRITIGFSPPFTPLSAGGTP